MHICMHMYIYTYPNTYLCKSMSPYLCIYLSVYPYIFMQCTVVYDSDCKQVSRCACIHARWLPKHVKVGRHT